MKQLRKRLEALSEIFESEKAYVSDLKIWGEDFKRYLFQSETLTIEKKHSLSKTLFINLDAIIALHEQIAQELGRRNEYIREINKLPTGDAYKPIVVNDDTAVMYKDLEYHSVYYKYLNRFGVYRYYVSRLPTVEFDLDKECNMNRFFKQELMDFFNERNIELGPKHFIYRASQKLARYAILWNAVLHYEENPVFIEGINETVQKLKEIARDVDQTYGSINESYKIFRFSADLHYSEAVKNRIPLNLFQKQRKILKEGDLIIKYRYIKEPKMLRFIVLDTVMLICDVVKQGNVEIKYIITDPLPLFKYIVTERNIGYTFDNAYLESMNPLFLLERAGTDIVVIFFKDERLKKMYFDVIHGAMEEIRRYFRTNVDLRPLLEKTNHEILCCSTRDTKFSINAHEEGEHTPHDTVDIADGKEVKEDKDVVKDSKGVVEIVDTYIDTVDDNDEDRRLNVDKDGDRDRDGDGSDDRLSVDGKDESNGKNSSSKNTNTNTNANTYTNNTNNTNTNVNNTNDKVVQRREGDGMNNSIDTNRDIANNALAVRRNDNKPINDDRTGSACEQCTGTADHNGRTSDKGRNIDNGRTSDDNNGRTSGNGRTSDNSINNNDNNDNVNNDNDHNNNNNINNNDINNVNTNVNTNDSEEEQSMSTTGDNVGSKKKERSQSVIVENNRPPRRLRFATQLDSDKDSGSSSSSDNDACSAEQGQRKLSFFKRMLGQNAPDETKDQTFNIGEGDYRKIFRSDEQFLLFGTKEGLFKKIGPHFVSLYDKSVQKVVYDVANKIIIFLETSRICCAPFVPDQNTLHTKLITRRADDFFYGITLNKLTIAALTVSNNSTTSVSLFKVTIENRSVSVLMDRKLFVGCLVFDIAFFNTKLVIACRDFEMVDSDTLKTQELVDPLDLCVPFYFKELKNITALSVFTIESDVFLVCYDCMGFFIDSYGRTIRQNVIFVWYIRPIKFKIYKEYLVCVSDQEVAVWDINTANMVYYTRQEHLMFVAGSSSLLLYDQYSLYKLMLD
ncbi:RhoGEF GTPase [Trachipleistophora hominis]|uniref:RhoGEF GTPase n=1 Tax=Trachipleistophora hominis TaxID=72359 RepID=L7JUV3_TRAHO|nr:RhoGEF GTPase [Trachipleistophora hominis]